MSGDLSKVAELLEAAHDALTQRKFVEARALWTEGRTTCEDRVCAANLELQIEREIERIDAVLCGEDGSQADRRNACNRLAKLCAQWKADSDASPRVLQLHARTLNSRGNQLCELGGAANLAAARDAFAGSAALRRRFALDVPQYRNDLATSLSNKGNALRALGGADNLNAAIRAYDEAVTLHRQLDLDVPQYRSDLADSLNNKGIALRYLGGADNFTAAIVAHDEAFAMHSQLDLNNPKYRSDLATILSNKGSALRCLGRADNLAAAIKVHDQAIALRRGLDLGVPRYRNDLATTLSNKGMTLRGLGKADNLAAAIEVHDEAIALRSQLDLDNPEYCDDLASTFSNKGTALRDLGGADNITVAIQAYDQAIALRRHLDLDVPQYRDELASCLGNRALALRALGGKDNLTVAIQAYDQAVDLCRQLDLKVPAYCNRLASGLANKGLVLHDLGGADNLTAAIAAYNEAAALLRQLDLDVPLHRSDLAGAIANRGSALKALGGADNLTTAIKAYDEAAALFRQLDRAVPDHRRNLAVIFSNKGNTLQMLGGVDNLAAAIEANDEAVALLHQLDLGVPNYRSDLANILECKAHILQRTNANAETVIAALREALAVRAPLLIEGPHFQPPAGRQSADTFYWLMRALASVSRWDDATDIGDAALAVQRYLYQRGWTDTGERVELFDTTLWTYRMAGLGHLLPEVIEEETLEDSPGAAWDSIQMHDVAARHLDITIGEMISQGRNPHLGELLYARSGLTTRAARYFAGTADSARLRAHAAEVRGEVSRARGILDEYVSVRPRDPQGYLVRARFRHRRGDKAGALQDYGQAAVHIVKGTPLPTTAALDALGDVAEAWIGIELDEALTRHVDGGDAKALVSAVFYPLRDRLERQRDAVLEQVGVSGEPWRRPLVDCMVTRPWQQIQSRSDAVLAEVDAQKRRDAIAAARRETASWLDHVAAVVGRAVPRPWADFVDRLLAAVKELSAEPSGDSDKLETAIGHAVRTAMNTLSPDALADGDARLAAALAPDNLAALDGAERRYLAVAFACADNPTLARFTALQVGCAIEYSLQGRLFEPLRRAWLAAGETPPLPRDADRFQRLHQYLSEGGPIMLGPLVGALTEAMKQVDGGFEPDLIGAIATHLARHPRSALLGMSAELRRQRNGRLEYLADQRNAASHPAELVKTSHGLLPPTEAARLVLDAAVRAPQVAFFRYFPFAAPQPTG